MMCVCVCDCGHKFKPLSNSFFLLLMTKNGQQLVDQLQEFESVCNSYTEKRLFSRGQMLVHKRKRKLPNIEKWSPFFLL